MLWKIESIQPSTEEGRAAKVKILEYIAKLRNHTPEEMNEILNKKSGVYGISEVSVDFRDIEAEYAEGNHKAIMALENFAYQVARLYS